ncbi:MAG: PilZ domain-containing protein, partial [Clostridium sp.]
MISCGGGNTFDLGEEVLIHISDKKRGILIYEGIVQGIIKNTIMLKRVRLIENSQRREKVRVIVNMPIEVEKIKKEEWLINLDKPIYMVSKNLSASGILLESTLDIPKEVGFVIHLPIGRNEIQIETITKRKY